MLERRASQRPCHLVIEAIVESIDAKREVFSRLESVTRENCILASNNAMSLFRRSGSFYWWVKLSHNERRIQQSTGASDKAKAQ